MGYPATSGRDSYLKVATIGRGITSTKKLDELDTKVKLNLSFIVTALRTDLSDVSNKNDVQSQNTSITN